MVSDMDDSFRVLNDDAENLISAVDDALSQPKLDVGKIIPIYYSVMTVKSLAKILQEKISTSDDEKDSLLVDKIIEIQSFISERFDSNLHELVMEYLANSVAEISEKLRSENSSEKSKEQIESEAKMYENLREIMSTREFVEQYEKGIL